MLRIPGAGALNGSATIHKAWGGGGVRQIEDLCVGVLPMVGSTNC